MGTWPGRRAGIKVVTAVTGAGGWRRPAARLRDTGGRPPSRPPVGAGLVARQGRPYRGGVCMPCAPWCQASVGLPLWLAPRQARRRQPERPHKARPVTTASCLPQPSLPGFLSQQWTHDGSGARQGGPFMSTTRYRNYRFPDHPIPPTAESCPTSGLGSPGPRPVGVPAIRKPVRPGGMNNRRNASATAIQEAPVGGMCGRSLRPEAAHM